MLKRLSFLLFLISFSFLSNAQAIIKFDNAFYNFKTINEADGIAQHEYVFTNTGNEDLKITKMTKGCGCTDPQFSDSVIKPNMKSTIKVAFDPKDKDGAFMEHVVVFSNAANGDITLTVSGNVTPKPVEKRVLRRVDSFPYAIGALRFDGAFKTFGKIYADRIDTLAFKVYNYSKQGIRLEGISDVPPYMTAIIKSNYIEPGEISELLIVLNSKESGWYGEMNQTFYLTTSEPGVPEHAIHIHAHIFERFPQPTKKYLKKAPKAVLVSSSTVDLGKILTNTKVDFHYELKNDGKKPLIVRNVVSVCGCTFAKTETTTIEPGKTAKINATFDTNGRQEKQEKYITIITNDPINPEIKVRFVANIVDNPNALDK